MALSSQHMADAYAEKHAGTVTRELPPRSAQSLYGTVIDHRFIVGARIGEGRTGEVFEIEAPKDNHLPALVLKTLKPDFAQNPEYTWRLRQEAWVGTHVKASGIAKTVAYGEHIEDPISQTASHALPYVVLERVFGESLLSYHWRQPFDWTNAIFLVRRLAEVLHPVHVAGIVHRDIKPEHIYLEPTGDQIQLHLIDFGVCTSPYASLSDRKREQGRVYGTPSYSSPEQATGEPNVDERADIFALGVVLFELITGRVPFTGNRAELVLQRIASEDAPRVGLMVQEVPRAVDHIVAKCLSRRKEQRFQTTASLIEALMTLEHSFQIDGASMARHISRRLHSDHKPTLHKRDTLGIAALCIGDTSTTWVGVAA